MVTFTSSLPVLPGGAGKIVNYFTCMIKGAKKNPSSLKLTLDFILIDMVNNLKSRPTLSCGTLEFVTFKHVGRKLHNRSPNRKRGCLFAKIREAASFQEGETNGKFGRYATQLNPI